MKRKNIKVINIRFIKIALSLITLMVLAITAYDISTSYRDIYKSKSGEAVSLLSSVQKAAENSYIGSMEVESLIIDKLLNNALLLSVLESEHSINKNDLNRISAENEIDHISIYSGKGNLLTRNDNIPYSELNISRLFSSETDSIIKGHYDYFIAESAQDEAGIQHMLVLHKRGNGEKGYFALSIENTRLLEFRKRIGVGSLLQKIADGNEIAYIAIQDTGGILTANKGVKGLSSLAADTLLNYSIKTRSTLTRETEFGNNTVFEAIRPFTVDNETIGIIRIGFSLDSMNDLLKISIIRTMVVSVLLLLLTVISIIYVSRNQSYTVLETEYKKVQDYTSAILDNMSDAVIVTDAEGQVQLMNKAAEKLTGIPFKEIKDKNFSGIFNNPDNLIGISVRTHSPVDYYEDFIKRLDSTTVIIGGGTSIIYNNYNLPVMIITVLRDLTERRKAEDIQKRQEKLSAMGELAAGVAHEIRNPLNLISITVQRFAKEFIPQNESEEYYTLINNIRSEITRTTGIIEQFLNFARPPALIKKMTNIREMISDILITFESSARQKGVILSMKSADIFAEIDSSQMRQALINLIQNALDSIDENGEIIAEASANEHTLTITISDTGHGIKPEEQKNVFNIYYTTKAGGNGLGLSLVNRIITSHGGRIYFTSRMEKETIFTIEIPIK